MTGFRHVLHQFALDLRRFLSIFSQIDREAVASHYLRGTGIEIGALHNPLKVPRAVNVRYVDRMTVAELRKQYPELASKELVEADIIDDGEKLSTIEDGTQNFVIANHFLEHCEDPIHALSNLVRVLRKDGILYMCVPDKRYTFDIDRPVTPFDHIVKDHAEGPGWSRNLHLDEWVRVVEKVKTEAEIQKRFQYLMDINYSIHYHVWTQREMFELIQNLKDQFEFPIELEMFMKNNGEALLILRKTR
jgi:predicted SAM-dependent methyltransferase